jgi:hypothetical protein
LTTEAISRLMLSVVLLLREASPHTSSRTNTSAAPV